MEFKLDGVEQAIVLPDEYLTVKQWEDCLRYFKGAQLEELEFDDLGTLRAICQLLLEKDVELAGLPMTKNNLDVLMKMYAHMGNLLSEAMSLGDESVDEAVKSVEEKTPTPQRKKRGRKSIGAAKSLG